MTGAEYAAVADAFLNPPQDTEPSFRSVARLTGHSARTIQRVFHEGAANMPPISEMLEERARREKLKRLREAERVEQYLRGLHGRMLSGLGRALAETPVALEPITNAKSAKQAVGALKELVDIAHELNDDRDRESAPSVAVNVNIAQAGTVDPVAVRKAAQAIMLRHAELFSRVTGTVREAEITAALLAEQARRQAAQNDEEDEDE